MNNTAHNFFAYCRAVRRYLIAAHANPSLIHKRQSEALALFNLGVLPCAAAVHLLLIHNR